MRLHNSRPSTVRQRQIEDQGVRLAAKQSLEPGAPDPVQIASYPSASRLICRKRSRRGSSSMTRTAGCADHGRPPGRLSVSQHAPADRRRRTASPCTRALRAREPGRGPGRVHKPTRRSPGRGAVGHRSGRRPERPSRSLRRAASSRAVPGLGTVSSRAASAAPPSVHRRRGSPRPASSAPAAATRLRSSSTTKTVFTASPSPSRGRPLLHRKEKEKELPSPGCWPPKFARRDAR